MKGNCRSLHCLVGPRFITILRTVCVSQEMRIRNLPNISTGWFQASAPK